MSSEKKSSTAVPDITEAQLYELIGHSTAPYVVVNFYTTWCKPCIKEIPELLRLHRDDQGEASVLFISLDDPTDVVQKLPDFLVKHGIDFPTYHYNIAEAGQFIKKVNPQWNNSIPLNLIFARNGRLVETTGMTEKSEVELIINQDKSFYQGL